MEDLNATVQLGSTAVNMATTYAKSKATSRLTIIDGLLHDVSQAISVLDSAYGQVMSGVPVDYSALYNQTNNVIETVRTGLQSLAAAAAAQGLGFLPFVPFGPGENPGGSSGMFTPGTPQGAAPSSTNMMARSLAPRINMMRMKMREIQQIVSRLRSEELARAQHGLVDMAMSGLGSTPLAQVPGAHNMLNQTRMRMNLPVNACPPVPTFWTALAVGMIGAGFYHGYRRNNSSVAYGLAWSLFGFLGGPAIGAIGVGLALAQGFGEPIKKDESK
ncbi:MAG: hypothetical protein EBU84_12925 [Actinobacteria bacterium]|nr:hypothetical protein [Actinomycetota bacterium]